MLTIIKNRTIRPAQYEARVNLRQLRQWFDDNGSQQGAGNTSDGNSPETGKYNPTTLEDAQRIIEALQKRVGERDETISLLKAQHSTLAQQVQAIQDAQKKKLEEDGNYAELAKQRAAEIAALQPVAERAAALEKILRESNEARIKNVPEQIRSMIPMDYPPERLQKWLADNEALLSKPPAPNFDAGAGAGAGQGSVTPKLTDEQKQLAKKVGMTDEQYAAAMHKAQGET